MDTSVALVQAYLHVNGYFTVAEYPVLEAYRDDHARTVTDPALGVLALIEKWGVEAQPERRPNNRQKERTNAGVRVHRRS